MGLAANFRHWVESRVQALRLIARQLGQAIVPAGTFGPDMATISFKHCQLCLHVVLCAVAGRRLGRAADAFIRAARTRNWQEDTPGNRDQAGFVMKDKVSSTAAGPAL